MYWNLYVDDLSIMEIVTEDWMAKQEDSGSSVSSFQSDMEEAYQKLGVPYSADKAECRRVKCEKLGAYIDGDLGVIGISSSRALDFITLCLFVMSQERVPTKWSQIVMGKYVHIVQFRRPLFTLPKLSWDRISRFHGGGPLTAGELDEWMTLCMTLPLAYTNLRAKVSGQVTCSDASPSGGGLCFSTGLTPLGRLGSYLGSLKVTGEPPKFLTIEWFAGIGGMSRALERLNLRSAGSAVCECDEACVAILRRFLPGCIVWKDIRAVGAEEIRTFLDQYPDVQGVIDSGGSPCQGLSQLSSERQHFDDVRSGLFYELVRVNGLVKAECKARGLWHVGFVENVVCDEADQEIFRDLTEWDQWLLCSGSLSTVRRPRFFWVSEKISFDDIGAVEPGVGYRVARVPGPFEPPNLWVSPGWSWVSESNPVNLPTFTRSIPRYKPPVRPAGLHHTPEEARARWASDWFRFPPYTYKDEYCMTKGGFMRVACACEREILMGFSPGHTRLRKQDLDEDTRCSMIGNSFHTTIVALLLRQCLLKHFPELESVSAESLHAGLVEELKISQREIYQGHQLKPKLEDNETWLDRLEQQSEAVPTSPSKVKSLQVQLVMRFLENMSFRGTDVHIDTMSFFRPGRLPRAAVDSRQWVWRVARGWKWKFPDHINLLELEALYHTVRWRAKTLRLFNKRWLHLVDSQVVLGVAAKGRTSSRKLFKSLHKYNLLILALHTYPLLGWVLSHLNPADEPSRWYDVQPS